MKLWVVHWSNASLDDDGNCSAFGNIHGAYTTLKEAQAGLVECKDEVVDGFINNPDLDEDDKSFARDNLRVYGSVKENYFEVDFDQCDVITETYISIAELEQA